MTSKREEAIVKIFVQGMLGVTWENLESINRQFKKYCPEFSPKVEAILEAVDNLQIELRESTPKFEELEEEE